MSLCGKQLDHQKFLTWVEEDFVILDRVKFCEIGVEALPQLIIASIFVYRHEDWLEENYVYVVTLLSMIGSLGTAGFGVAKFAYKSCGFGRRSSV